MNWQSYWDQQAIRHENPHAQVARVQGGKASNQKELVKIAAYIKETLDIQATDHVLDVCCGNGMLSHELATYCATLLGIDFSAPHVKIAKESFCADNITFLLGDARQLPGIEANTFEKINLFFSFQYFDSYEEGEQVIIQMANKLKVGGKILIGDVPDAAKLHVFYPSFFQRLRYRLARIRGRDLMGRFWKESDMRKMAARAGLHIEKREQPKDFLYQHYRVDYLMGKEGDDKREMDDD